MSTLSPDPYEVLGVPKGAELLEICSASLKLMHKNFNSRRTASLGPEERKVKEAFAQLTNNTDQAKLSELEQKAFHQMEQELALQTNGTIDGTLKEMPKDQKQEALRQAFALLTGDTLTRQNRFSRLIQFQPQFQRSSSQASSHGSKGSQKSDDSDPSMDETLSLIEEMVSIYIELLPSALSMGWTAHRECKAALKGFLNKVSNCKKQYPGKKSHRESSHP